MNKKILIVEDEKILAEMYCDKFANSGWQVVLARSAEEAIIVLREEKPDLILLDILLPRMNGIDFVQEYKKQEHNFKVPIVAFSNYDDPETRQKATDLGVKEYLIKTNYTPQEIVDRVKIYL